jgi:hypothetical protein
MFRPYTVLPSHYTTIIIQISTHFPFPNQKKVRVRISNTTSATDQSYSPCNMGEQHSACWQKLSHTQGPWTFSVSWETRWSTTLLPIRLFHTPKGACYRAMQGIWPGIRVWKVTESSIYIRKKTSTKAIPSLIYAFRNPSSSASFLIDIKYSTLLGARV